ncbi:MAG: Putative integral membrane protein [Candidatus Tokpelaia hoelldobleri]|uniref:Integral membrane protein n=1 Tax=Candidatus Tokpelaia hoelldobleri TaxID=1902579 RepID=A0A1U9JWX5_9HYPH|nr:MAG: Putative integral membrane protein [Candidatus Tokpelaia hoelldoblerii]
MLRFSRQELALIAATFLWGGTFLLVQIAQHHSDPFFFVGMRFLTATLFLVALFHKTLRGLTLHELAAGAAVGVAIFFGYSLQTVGLNSITSSQSAFITALYVPIVPLLQWLILRRPPVLTSWTGIALAFLGLVLLTNPGKASFAFSIGEIVTLLGAFAIAVEIILIGRFAAFVDSRRITIVQVAVACVLSFLAMPVVGEKLPQFSWIWLVIACSLGGMSALIQLVMNWAQKSVSPTRATVIYAGEPVWAGIIGRLAGERLPGIAIFGAVCIVVGVLVSELKLPMRKKARRKTAE